METVSQMLKKAYIGHGNNGVDGASGPGCLHADPKTGQWAGAKITAVQPRLVERVNSQNLGDGYSTGTRQWIVTAGDLRRWLHANQLQALVSDELASLPSDIGLEWGRYSW